MLISTIKNFSFSYILIPVLSIVHTGELKGQDVDTLSYFTQPFDCIPVLVPTDEHATQFSPDSSFKLLEILIIADLNDTARLFLKEDSTIILYDSLYVMPGRSFFDTLITFSAAGNQYDVIDVRDYNINRQQPFWVSVRYFSEPSPFPSSSLNPGDDIKVDMTRDPFLGFPWWVYTGCYKGIAIVIEREGTSINQIDDNQNFAKSIPALFQNYPNPLNPNSIITFFLPEDEYVRLEVFDFRGKLVNILLNDYLHEGYHEVFWNGRDSNEMELPSGIYFYRIKTSNFSVVRKMVILK